MERAAEGQEAGGGDMLVGKLRARQVRAQERRQRLVYHFSNRPGFTALQGQTLEFPDMTTTGPPQSAGMSSSIADSPFQPLPPQQPVLHHLSHTHQPAVRLYQPPLGYGWGSSNGHHQQQQQQPPPSLVHTPPPLSIKLAPPKNWVHLLG